MVDLVAIGLVQQAMRDGDMSDLIERLRDARVALTQEERDFLADFIEGKIKHKRGPKKSKAIDIRDVEIWKRYGQLRQRGDKSESAYALIKEEFSLSRSAVTDAIGRIEKVIAGQEQGFRAWPQLFAAAMTGEQR